MSSEELNQQSYIFLQTSCIVNSTDMSFLMHLDKLIRGIEILIQTEDNSIFLKLL